MTTRRDHLLFLDQLRGLAIICVFLYHSLYQAFGRDQLDWNGWLRNFDASAAFLSVYPFTWGWCGVAIFFAVSGFCIHLSHAKAQQPSFVDFFIRRWFRIYPPFLAALLFFAFVFPPTRLDLHTRFGLVQLFSHLLLVHNLDARTEHGIAVAWWSVAVEFQLYLLYPLLLTVARRIGWQRALLLTAIIELGMRLGCDIYMLDTQQRVSALLRVSPFYYWFSWAAGAAIADAYIKGDVLPFARHSTWLWVALLIAADLIKPLNVFSFTFAALATATAIARLLDGRTPPAIGGVSLLRRRIADHVRLAGTCSYSIYLLHHPIVVAWARLVRLILPGAEAYPLFMYGCCLAAWAFILPLSMAMYRYVELPGIALGKRFIEIWHRRRAVAKLPVGAT